MKKPVFLLIFLLSACAGKDNVSPPANLLDIESALVVENLWTRDTGKGVGEFYLRLEPLLTPGYIVAASSEGRVSAYRPGDGKLLWSNRLDEAITAGVNGGEGIAVVGTEEGVVIALSEDAGKPLWRQQLSSQVTAVSAVAQGVLVVRSGDGYLYGLDKMTGEIRWKLHRQVPALSLQSQSTPLLRQGVVIAGLDNGRLILLSQEHGEVLWEQTIALASGRSELERIVDIDGRIGLLQDIIYVVTYQGKIAAVDMRSGRIQWRQDASSPLGLTVDGGQVFYTDENSVVWALDRNSGASLWKQEAFKYRALTSPVVMGDTLVVADYQGYLHWLERATGRIVARERADHDGVLAIPRVAGERLVVLGKGGELSSWSMPALAR